MGQHHVVYWENAAPVLWPFPKLLWDFLFISYVAQWYNVGLWPTNFPCSTLDLQLIGDHYCG